TNKDIVLLVENELRDIVNVEYINQESSLDNHNKKTR
ncbi:putative exported domain protein, partial [Clostridioides difficile P1]